MFPWTYNALSLLHYHVVPGWHHSDHMKKSEMLPTLYYGRKPVRVNRVTKNDVSTTNVLPTNNSSGSCIYTIIVLLLFCFQQRYKEKSNRLYADCFEATSVSNSALLVTSIIQTKSANYRIYSYVYWATSSDTRD